MDTLTNKTFEHFDYNSRLTPFPFYYDKIGDRYVYGLSSNVKKDIPYVSHKVAETDSLDSLALKYYNNPTYWWYIAYFNDIQDAFVNLYQKYSIIQIPSISSLQFGRHN